ncbi:hypothetical protein ACLKMY_21195 [Paraburkholderia mimosarum]|uniref:hypothetical protein n=1 Tax=Paraburkholderia mimosarum TaxID=312026 RepID=UPI0039C154CF
MDLLQWLIDHGTNQWPAQRAYHSPLEILTQQHGSRSVRHPAAREHMDYTRMLLESMVHDGLAETDGVAGFRASAAAVAVAETYLIEERRHADNQRTQHRLLWVAIAAGAAAVVQAGAAVWQSTSHETPQKGVRASSALAAQTRKAESP